MLASSPAAGGLRRGADAGGGEGGRLFLFVATLSYSRRPFVLAFRHERQSAWLDGIEGAFREYATEFNIRPELRFNDLRGTKVPETVWSGISVPDLAIRIGWKIETAAKMLGVYAAVNPGRAMVIALPAPAQQDHIRD